ncbi:MAG: hypothetical protein PHF58_13560 [Methylotenera sp.]|nr:hypothetical protein [Methylotenera sp.]
MIITGLSRTSLANISNRHTVYVLADPHGRAVRSSTDLPYIQTIRTKAKRYDCKILRSYGKQFVEVRNA